MQAFLKPVIRCISNPRCTLGEGVFWDKSNHLLYWVDILERRIYRYDPSNQNTQTWEASSYVGFVVIKNGKVIAGLKDGLYNLSLGENGKINANHITNLDEGNERVRVNDGYLDDKGRVWISTMDMNNDLPLGKFFCCDDEYNIKIIDDGYIVANGPAISPNGNTLYTVETVGSRTRGKGIYEFRLMGGQFQYQRKLVDWLWDSYPDGLITDHKGRIWIGEFGGNILRCFLPDGTLCSAIELPAFNVTKAVIGGAENDKFYVSSACIGVDKSTLEKYPHTGGILEIDHLLD